MWVKKRYEEVNRRILNVRERWKEISKMSVIQLDEEARKVMEQIKSMPRDIRSKKKADKGRKEIKFYAWFH